MAEFILKNNYFEFNGQRSKWSIVYSETLSIPRIFSYKNDFQKHLEEMKSWFRVRRYLDNLVKDEMGK